jgi:hypothetical protein
MLFETRQVDQCEDGDGATAGEDASFP